MKQGNMKNSNVHTFLQQSKKSKRYLQKVDITFKDVVGMQKAK
jgi:AAA+ superfamily predicted ATPase